MTAIGSFVSFRIQTSGGDFAACHPVTHLEATQLQISCQGDISGSLQKSLLTFAYGLNGLTHKRYAWSTVQFYYSVYYALHCILICNNVGLFHYQSKPGVVELSPGGIIRKLTKSEAKGGSHGSCLEVFRRNFPSHPLNTPIGSEDALGWLKRLREVVNYSEPRFSDPNLPQWFEKSIGRSSIRQITNAYCADPVYFFDPDHAAVAFPLLALRNAVQEANRRSVTLSEEDRKAACTALRDETGLLAPVVSYLGF